MKHQVPESMKFRKLQRRLGTSRLVTVGTLELLWLSTQKNCPQGDIGKFTNEEIAIECEWEGDADELVGSLVATGWLDLDDVHRLIVHDWEEHAPGWIKRQLKRHGKSFVTPSSRPSVTGDAQEATKRPPSAPRDAQEATRNPTQPNLKKPNDASASCSEPATPPSEPPRTAVAVDDPVVLEFQVNGNPQKPLWPLRRSKLLEYAESFPGIDVEAELLKARQWCRDAGNKRKTAAGMPKFLGSWLGRAQNDAARNQRGSPDRAAQPTFREIEAAKFLARHATVPPQQAEATDGNLRLRYDAGEPDLRGLRAAGR